MAERQFKIKMGTLRRLKKDLEFYTKEHVAQEAKIAKMRAEDCDEYDIRKQEEVLVETETMLPDCQTRLREAATDLRSFLAANEQEVTTLESFPEAQELLDAVATLL